MQFIHALLLLGILAVAIPIIIQLLHRKHSRIIDWGAMVFLDAAMKKRRRSVLLEDILLLACRCLIPALAAFALARPFVLPDSRVPWIIVLPAMILAIILFGMRFALWRYKKWSRICLIASFVLAAISAASILLERKFNLSRFGGAARKDVAIVFDGSASMSMLGEDGTTNFEKAVGEAQKYIEDSPRGTSFSIIVGGPVPEILTSVPIADRKVLRETLEMVRPTGGTMNAPAALAAAAVSLAAGNNAVRQIIVIGDGQAEGWELNSAGRWDTIQSLFAELRPSPLLVWRTLPLPASVRNVAIESVKLSREAVGCDRDVYIDVSVVNTGTEAITPGAVSVDVEGQTLSAKDLRQLEPGASNVVNFKYKFKKPGSVVVTARVEASDDLPSDDEFKLVVPVLDTLNVLIVDGDGTGAPGTRAASFISLALRPEISKQVGAKDSAGFLLNTTVEDVVKTGSRKDFSTFAVVALCNTPKLQQETMKALAEFVRMGGGLLFLPGAKTSPSAFNDWSAAGERVLPLRLGQWEMLEQSDGEPVHIDAHSFTHEALRTLRTGLDLGTVVPLQRWSFDTGIDDANATQAAAFSDGKTFLAIQKVGRGTVVESALPFDSISSDLPLKLGFVPLAHEICYHLARPITPDLNMRPQESANLLLVPRVSTTKSGDAKSESGHGLVGHYFQKKSFTGKSKVRLDPTINMNWGRNAPFPHFVSDNFSVHWSGSFVAPWDGDYAFSADVDDYCRILIDGKLHTEENYAKKAPFPKPLTFRRGERHNIEIFFREDSFDARMILYWNRPGKKEREVVPASALFPPSGDGTPADLIKVVDPRGDSFFGELRYENDGLCLKIARPLIPGLYQAEGSEDSNLTGMESVMAKDGKIPFYVTAGTDESRIQAVAPEQEDLIRKRISFSIATKIEDVVAILHGSAFGQEVWQIFAVALLVFLVLEVALARWISIRRRAGEATDVDFRNEGDMGKASFKDALKKLKG